MVLRKIKQFLGLGSQESSGRSEQDVVVQEDSSEPDTETEAAVKGVDEEAEQEEEAAADEESEAEDDESEAEEDEVEEPVAAATDADASTESLVDEDDTEEHPESRAEPAEAAGPSADDETTDVEDVDPAEESAAPEIDTGDADAEGTSVDEVKGIGPAYSDRLAEIGIQSVDQLVAADAEELAERIAVPEKTVQKWIDRAQEQSD